jgi:hypothetical protein
MSDIDETVKRLRTAGFEAVRVNVVQSDHLERAKAEAREQGAAEERAKILAELYSAENAARGSQDGDNDAIADYVLLEIDRIERGEHGPYLRAREDAARAQVLRDVVERLRKQASTARAWPTVLALKKAADDIERDDWKAGDDE